MSSRCRSGMALLALALLGAAAQAQGPAAPLRVCADADNLPYSREDGSGFENRIVQWLAEALHRPLQVSWVHVQRGLVRRTFGQDLCDVLPGLPSGFERVLPTRPYYRSGYVFLSRELDGRPLRGFDDARLAELRIGVQLPGADQAATPVGHALAQRGARERVVGFPPLGEVPPVQRMVQALVAGELDAAVVWGPQAGFFAQRAGAPLVMTPARPPAGLALPPFEFDMVMGVRRDQPALRDEIDAALAGLQPRIDALLAQYGLPRVPAPPGPVQARAVP